jgi:hypothetical protein
MAQPLLRANLHEQPISIHRHRHSGIKLCRTGDHKPDHAELGSGHDKYRADRVHGRKLIRAEVLSLYVESLVARCAQNIVDTESTKSIFESCAQNSSSAPF